MFGAEIPTYRWSYEVAKSEQGLVLRLHVEQHDVSSGFKMAVPVEIRFRDGRVGTMLAFVDEPYQPSAKRYASPVESGPRWRLFGLARSSCRISWVISHRWNAR